MHDASYDAQYSCPATSRTVTTPLREASSNQEKILGRRAPDPGRRLPDDATVVSAVTRAQPQQVTPGWRAGVFFQDAGAGGATVAATDAASAVADRHARRAVGGEAVRPACTAAHKELLMKSIGVFSVVFAYVSIAMVPAPVSAQTADKTSVSFFAGGSEYDLAGVGCTAVFGPQPDHALLAPLAVQLAVPVHGRSQAQTRRRHGFWLSSGIGAGWDLFGQHDDGGSRGWSGYTRLGGTPTDRLRVGAEVGYWLRRQDELLTQRGNLIGVLQYYPTDLADVFVKGGAGLSIASEDWEILPGVVAVHESFGVGLTFGAGIDIPAVWITSVTLNMDWLGAAGLSGEPSNFSLFLLTLGLTFQGR